MTALVRLTAMVALAGLASVQWGAMQEPGTRVRLLVCAAIALAAGIALLLADRRGGRRRTATQAAVLLAAAAGVLLAARVPLGMLDPRAWDDLALGLGEGLEALAGIGVPYRGVDPWIHTVLVAGGGALFVLAAALAARSLRRGGRPVGAGVALAAAYVIPVVERPPAAPLLSGALFTVGLGALLWGDRIERAHARPALVFAAVAIVAAVPAAARLDAREPWVDYRSMIESLSTPPAVGFDWEHGYGPLDWPRENRVMLRVAAEVPSYWKATDLESFDGKRWVARGDLPPGTATETAPGHADWRRELRVFVRDLRSAEYVTAGVGLEVSGSPRLVLPSAPGTFTTGSEELRRGDAYVARVYAPNPSVRELRSAGTDYPEFVVAPYLFMDLPVEVGGPDTRVPGAPATLGPVQLQFPAFRNLTATRRALPLAADGAGGVYGGYGTGTRLLDASQYAPMWRLAQRMRLASDTPYELVRRVQARLASSDYVYTETPPPPSPGRPPLVSFLFDAKAGYCQQFSGAMALLLRMAGVPARVSSGFSPGTYDEGRRQWVVRDVDAHSWVEAYFPRLGWVTFDPTPGVAPAGTQLLNGPAPLGTPDIPLRPDARRADVPETGGAAGSPEGPSAGGETSPGLVIALTVLAGALTAGGLALRDRRRRAGALPDLAELQLALRRTGREPEPDLTLKVLEERLRQRAPAAAEYVTVVRLARFAGRAGRPSERQRAALREELAAGLGPVGRVRAWWALPPSWTRPRPPYTRG